jgi:hemerythrin superfamily protein
VQPHYQAFVLCRHVIKEFDALPRLKPSVNKDAVGLQLASWDSCNSHPTKETPMATAKKAPAKKTSNKTASTSATPDAIKLLTADHREVKTLFQQYQGLVDHEAEDDEKQALAQQICQMLTVHAQIEEELFYPAAQESIKEAELVDEANVEHASAKDLIAQLESSDPSDKLFDAKVKVLGEYIDHHVKEEEGEMFPQARRAKMDLQALGEQLAQRKQALMEEMGIGEEDTAEAENSAS